MPNLRSGLVAVICGLAPPALADCNPPPTGLGPEQWYSLCIVEIQNTYQQYGAGWDYQMFVTTLYQTYVQASLGVGIGGQSTACAPDGQSYCNSSGWLMTCTNGQWLTGAVNCNQ